MNSNERNLRLAAIAIRTAIKKQKDTETTKALRYWIKLLSSNELEKLLSDNLKIGGEWGLSFEDIDYFRLHNRAIFIKPDATGIEFSIFGNVNFDW